MGRLGWFTNQHVSDAVAVRPGHECLAGELWTSIGTHGQRVLAEDGGEQIS